MTQIDSFFKSMQTGKEHFVLTDEGDINKFLGIEITQLDAKKFKVSQPLLTDGDTSKSHDSPTTFKRRYIHGRRAGDYFESGRDC